MIKPRTEDETKVLSAYLTLAGFPAKAIFLPESELDYSAMPEVKEALDSYPCSGTVAPWLYLWSHGKGSGKSLAAARSAIRLARALPHILGMPTYNGYDHASIRFVPVLDLLVKLRSTMGDRAMRTEDEILDPIKKAQFLILDDLGAEKPSEYSARVLMEVISYRNAHLYLKTIITSNFSLNELASRYSSTPECAEYADRIVDRIDEVSHVIELPSNNFRSMGTPNFEWAPAAAKAQRQGDGARLFAPFRVELGLEEAE